MTTEDQKTRQKRWDRLIVYGVIIVIPMIFTVGLFWHELESRVDDVQESRAEITYIGCLEQNERNEAARAAVKTIFDQSVAAGEQTREEADTAIAATASIVDALAPTRDCQALVEARFGYVPSAPSL